MDMANFFKSDKRQKEEKRKKKQEEKRDRRLNKKAENPSLDSGSPDDSAKPDAGEGDNKT